MKMKKVVSVLLAVIIVFSTSVIAFAQDEGYGFFPHTVDNIFGIVQDGLFALLTGLNQKFNLPNAKDYKLNESDYFYPGTDGKVQGNGWKAGFADNSIVPAEWRCDANGNADPNGYCLNGNYAGGGYQAEMNKIYTDQNVNVVVLSNGCDTNNNGKEDIVIIVSCDGVGITNGTCRAIRAGIEDKLASFGIESGDILSCTVSATHCHAGLDIQGMYWKVILKVLFTNLFKKLFAPDSYMLTLDEAMYKTLINQTADAVSRAYGSMESGNLYFFNTEETDGARDKFQSGAKTQNRFSSYMFESDSGVKTIVSNIGAHPVSANAQNTHLMVCDYPWFMKQAMKDAGYNFVFLQGTQAGVSSPDVAETDDGKAWAEENGLSREQWVERYGEDVAAELYDSGEEDWLRGQLRKGYDLAHYVIDASESKTAVAPTLNIKATETILDCDYGLMQLGAATGVMNFNAVKSRSAESGYGIVVELGYIEIGDDVAFITVPGELSPAVVYGTKDGYDGNTMWKGAQSWNGTDWDYKTLEAMVRTASEDSDKQVIVMGLTNDAIGYNLPDPVTTQGILTPLLFYNGEGGNEVSNSMLMTVSNRSASQIVEGFGKLLDTPVK